MAFILQRASEGWEWGYSEVTTAVAFVLISWRYQITLLNSASLNTWILDMMHDMGTHHARTFVYAAKPTDQGLLNRVWVVLPAWSIPSSISPACLPVSSIPALLTLLSTQRANPRRFRTSVRTSFVLHSPPSLRPRTPSLVVGNVIPFYSSPTSLPGSFLG